MTQNRSSTGRIQRPMSAHPSTRSPQTSPGVYQSDEMLLDDLGYRAEIMPGQAQRTKPKIRPQSAPKRSPSPTQNSPHQEPDLNSSSRTPPKSFSSSQTQAFRNSNTLGTTSRKKQATSRPRSAMSRLQSPESSRRHSVTSFSKSQRLESIGYHSLAQSQSRNSAHQLRSSVSSSSRGSISSPASLPGSTFTGDGHDSFLLGGIYRNRIASGPIPTANEAGNSEASLNRSSRQASENNIEIMTKKRMPLTLKLHTGAATRALQLNAQRRHRKIIKNVRPGIDLSEPTGRTAFLKRKKQRGEKMRDWDVPLAGKAMWSMDSLHLLREQKKMHDKYVKQALKGKNNHHTCFS